MDFSSLAQTVKILAPGLRYTVGLFAITLVLSLPRGLLLAFAAEKRRGVLATIIRGYVALMRGTPLMLQLFFIYFGLPVLPVVGEYLVMGRFPAACVAFVLNYAAYFCEIFRGGLLAVDRGQYEAAQVLGLRRLRTKLTIAVPQMCKVSLPAVSNEVITLVKDTALGSVLSIPDLMKLATARVNATANIAPFLVAAVFYLVMTVVLTRGFDALEKKFRF